MKKSIKRVVSIIIFSIIAAIIISVVGYGIFLAVLFHHVLKGDMTPKKDVFAIVEQNRQVINDAAYVMYTNNIHAVYDVERQQLPKHITWIEGDYTIREADIYEIYSGQNKYVYEPLTDEYLITALNLDGVKKITKDANIIKLDFGAMGIVPSGAENGVCYLPNDSLEDAEVASHYYIGKPDFRHDGEGYTFYGSGNTFYVERICDNLWYYEVTW